MIRAPASLRTYQSHTPSCVFMRPFATPLLKSILYFDYLLWTSYTGCFDLSNIRPFPSRISSRIHPAMFDAPNDEKPVCQHMVPLNMPHLSHIGRRIQPFLYLMRPLIMKPVCPFPIAVDMCPFARTYQSHPFLVRPFPINAPFAPFLELNRIYLSLLTHVNCMKTSYLYVCLDIGLC